MDGPAMTDAETSSPVAATGRWVAVERGMLSRVLYANPVCLLTTRDPGTERRNVMTITWLTPINNQGGLVCSMNRNRHSAQFVNRIGAVFVLNVPTAGMEPLVLSIGGCSGARVDKFAAFDIACCAPGGGDWHPTTTTVTDDQEEKDTARTKKPKLSKQELWRRAVDAAAAQSVALRDCAAHVLCRVDRVEEDDGHLLLRCTQLAAWCREGYWDGKHFMPQRADAAPFLTFLGTQTFGYVCHSPTCERKTDETVRPVETEPPALETKES